jgi:cytochrome c biogenesis protein CcmG, thiol:disulfide interchange protein DsbE
MSVPRRRFAILCLLCALAVAGCGSSSATRGTAAGATPVAIGGLPARQDRLLDGGVSAFKHQLAALRGHPVVVNQWASWCGPCAFEFPFFRGLADKYRGQVAFLGVDAQDNRGDALAFLKRHPVPYPSYFDGDATVARSFRGGQAWPTTAFFNAAGKRTETHAGAYATQAKLEQDIRIHAING